MAIVRVNPQNVVTPAGAIEQQALQNQMALLGGRRQMVGAINEDLNQVTNYLDRANILNQLGVAQGAPVAQPQQPQVTEEVIDEVLASGGLVDEQKMAEFEADTAPLADPDVPPETMVAELTKRSQKLKAQGRDSADTDQLIQLATVAPQQAKLAIGNINQMIQNKAVRNFMARDPEAARSFLQGIGATGMDGQIQTNTLANDILKKQLEGQIKEEGDIRKELRSDLRSRLGEFDKNVNVLESNYKKIKNLSGEIKKGNRTAVAQAIVAMVKLNDPNSAVLDTEMKAALNTENPVAAVAAYLKGNNVADDVVNAVTANLDPLSADVVNVDDILSTANAMLSANVASLIPSYGELKSQSQNLTEQGARTLFNESREIRLANLAKIQPSSLSNGNDLRGMSDDELRAIAEGAR